MSEPLLIARTPDTELFLLPGMANRHGLITGATGTGKTVTLQKLAESLSEIGVPVFMADVKGDLTGVAEEGTSSEKLLARLKNIGVNDWQPHANPVVVWDIFGEKGHPVRATVSDLGPLLLARLLNLNDVQSGVLNIIFRIADDQGLLLLDFKDLRAITQYIGDNAKSFQNQYGNISSASVGAIQRGLLSLEQQGAAHFLVSRCWISKTGCVPMPTVKALSISSAPRSFIRCRNCTPPACCGCFQSCMNNCLKRAIWRNQNWCFSSTKHICCLTMRHRYCWIRLSR
mgnify:CR=1 FL=1